MDFEVFKRKFAESIRWYLTAEAQAMNSDPLYAHKGPKSGIIQIESDDKTAPAMMEITGLSDYDQLIKVMAAFAESAARELPQAYKMAWTVMPGWMTGLDVMAGSPVGHGDTSEVFIAMGIPWMNSSGCFTSTKWRTTRLVNTGRRAR